MNVFDWINIFVGVVALLFYASAWERKRRRFVAAMAAYSTAVEMARLFTEKGDHGRANDYIVRASRLESRLDDLA